MGNTNLPQFGAAGADNSRDTLKGDTQLSSDQLRQRDAQAKGGLAELLPDSSANESQRVAVHADHGKNVIGQPAAGQSEESSPDLQPTQEDRAALAGHVGTGHSPSDAT